MKKNLINLAAVLIAFASHISGLEAAEKTLQWSNGPACKAVVHFDSTKIDPTQLKNAGDLLYEIQGIMNLPSTQEAEADLAHYKKKCSSLIDHLRSMKFVDLADITTYRDNEAEALQEVCEVTEIDILGKQNPSFLRHFLPGAEACSAWISALEGKSDIHDALKELITEDCKSSQDKACVTKGLDKANASGLGYVKKYVHDIGWGHCANSFLKINTSSLKRMHQNLTKHFEQLFKVKNECALSTD